MKTSLSNTRVLVTGAGRRIGREIALLFAQQGATVAIHFNRSGNDAEQLLEQIGGKQAGHHCFQADLSIPEERAALIPKIIAEWGKLDCLVNNASIYRRCLLEDVVAETLREDYEINFVAPFLLMRDFARQCNSGNIINILDQRVANVDPSAATYGFAKKSLRDATEAAAVQWAPRIRVNAVAPGVVMAPPGIPEKSMERLVQYVPMAKPSTAEEVAEACFFLAAAKTITGQILYVDGGLHLVGPDLQEPDGAHYNT